MRAGLYVRVSTADQQPENQLAELRRYVQARGWEAVEYVDRGISGAKDRRPALDRLLDDARKRRLDAVVVWSLDRLGRSLRHLIVTIDELNAAGIAFISLRENIDTSSPTGKLMLGILGSFAEFERSRIVERVHAGLARARRQGTKLGRRRERIPLRDLERVHGLSIRQAAATLGVPPTRVHSERLRVFGNPLGTGTEITEETAIPAASV